MMHLSDFDYELPEALVAQQPLPQRTASRLMVLDRKAGQVEHGRFTELPSTLREGDLLIRNETRVIPARLLGEKETGGQVELLLVQQTATDGLEWQCMSKCSKPLRLGGHVRFPGGVVGEVVRLLEDGQRVVRFHCPGDFMDFLEECGHIPLPPYIRREDQLQDRERYQTVFAAHPGAIAAPTAGLHFTGETFASLVDRGVEVHGVTLHVGPGTFLPVRTDNLRDHRMHDEAYEVPEQTAVAINAAKAEGRRVIALGTTVTRTLEAAADEQGQLLAGAGSTDLFIRPGFNFKIVDALVTNFHLPKSTLLVLVAAFAGRDFVLRAYREAVAQKYRFFSYGDCMLIL